MSSERKQTSRARDPEAASEPEADVGMPEAESGAVDAAVVEAFEHELAEARREKDEASDRHLRAEADLQNLRRMSEQRVREAREQVRRDLLNRILEVGDNLERALTYADGEQGGLGEGVRATLRTLELMLEREGVARIDAADAPFDPELHEAVGVVDVPGLDGERVVVVERAGYTLDGDLLRPARVVVGRGPGV